MNHLLELSGSRLAKMIRQQEVSSLEEDLMPLLFVLTGPDGNHEHQRKFQLGDLEQVNLKNITILDVPGNGLIKVNRDLQKAQRECAKTLAAARANVKQIQIKELKKSFAIWSSMLAAAEGTSFQDSFGHPNCWGSR